MKKFIGFLFAATLVVCVVAVAVGYYQGWWTTTTHQTAKDTGKVVMAVEVDTDKIKSDTDAARKSVEKVSESVKEKIQDLTGHETAQGKIMEVDETASRVTLATKDGKNLTLHLTPASELKLKTKDATVKDLKTGDEVTVVYKVEDGKNQVRSITADQTS